MQPSTQELILEMVNKHRLVSVDELSRMLYMTKPNIQYHIKRMLQNQLLDVVKVPRLLTAKRGRPELFYRLSGNSASSNITRLCDLVLEEHMISGNREKLLKTLGRKILPAPPVNQSMPRLLMSLMEELNKRGYCCRWEAHKSGPRIIFASCPYAAIINNHPELCDMDIFLLENYLQFPVNQISKIDSDDKMPGECLFDVIVDPYKIKYAHPGG